MIKEAKNKKGTTLIELLISIAVFAIAVGINANIFISTLKSQKRSVGVQNVTDNARYAMEVITRELRTMNVDLTLDNGYCTFASCMNVNGDYSTIYFVSGSENRNLNIIKVSLNNGVIMFDDEVLLTPDDDMPITDSSKVNVVDLNFKVDNVSTSTQPRITIKMQVEPKNEPGNILNMQTTISPREINL